MQVAHQPQHSLPLCPVRAALPLIAQIVLVFLHRRNRDHQRFENGQARAKQGHAGQDQRAPRGLCLLGGGLHHRPAAGSHDAAAVPFGSQIRCQDTQSRRADAPTQMRPGGIMESRWQVAVHRRLLKDQEAFARRAKQRLADS